MAWVQIAWFSANPHVGRNSHAIFPALTSHELSVCSHILPHFDPTCVSGVFEWYRYILSVCVCVPSVVLRLRCWFIVPHCFVCVCVCIGHWFLPFSCKNHCCLACVYGCASVFMHACTYLRTASIRPEQSFCWLGNELCCTYTGVCGCGCLLLCGCIRARVYTYTSDVYLSFRLVPNAIKQNNLQEYINCKSRGNTTVSQVFQ